MTRGKKDTRLRERARERRKKLRREKLRARQWQWSQPTLSEISCMLAEDHPDACLARAIAHIRSCCLVAAPSRRVDLNFQDKIL